ncbi:hypothetical protein ACI75Y_02315 [Capnocytophaga stomatis]|uniref:hypothetical protein n=1 Tax=Capnocytophaga stomatis TaxID=1848904 RepID=UPI00385D7BB6
MENRKKWVEAASKLSENPSEKVLCPDCEKAFLNVVDVFLENNEPQKGIERYILCENCKKNEAILLRKTNIEYGVNQNNNIWYEFLINNRNED